MAKIFKLIFLGSFFFLLSACFDFALYDIHKLFDDKEIVFLGVELPETDPEDKNFNIRNNINEYAQYPSLSFGKTTFFSSWLSTFNNNPLNLKAKFLELSETKKFLNLEKIPNFFYFEDNLVLNLTRKDDLSEIFNLLNKDYYLIVGFRDKPWQQATKGYIKLFDRYHRLAWFNNFKATSDYIIFDKDSPYLIYNNLIRIKPNETSYEEEIKKIYAELGQATGQQIADKLVEIYNRKK